MTIPKDEIRTYADGPTVGAAGGNGSQEEETIPPTLDWTTFVRLATSKQRQQEKANHAFSLMDTTDKKGFLSIHDVARVAKELGEEFTEEEMEEMMTEADPSGDGLVVDADALFRIVREVNL
jgi:centrin-1